MGDDGKSANQRFLMFMDFPAFVAILPYFTNQSKWLVLMAWVSPHWVNRG